jgi:DNA (cytosine-5)-methyltransferase 1
MDYFKTRSMEIMANLTFGSLFAGIGGIDLGLERAGMTCKWQVEIDDYATKVLEKHWPDIGWFRDVRECGAHNLEAVDLIAGGFPCQDISYAGKGAGIKGERSGLWSEFHRVICELRPRYALLENVPALLGRGMGVVLADLAACGYDAEWQCLPAAAFGAPHIRDRLFVLAYADGQRCTNSSQRHNPLRLSKCLPTALPWFSKLPQSAICGKDNGVPNRVHRLRGLGNAVVPQVAEWIGHCIMEQVNGKKESR